MAMFNQYGGESLTRIPAHALVPLSEYCCFMRYRHEPGIALRYTREPIHGAHTRIHAGDDI
jgi:hypothetical protein